MAIGMAALTICSPPPKTSFIQDLDGMTQTASRASAATATGGPLR